MHVKPPCLFVATVCRQDVHSLTCTMCLQISDQLHIFEHSWLMAPDLAVSSISTPDPSHPAPAVNSMRNTEPMHFMHADPSPLCNDTPPHIVSDAPVTLTKGILVGCTEDVGDPWFRLNHEVDRRAGSAGRAKLLQTVSAGGSMHVFYDAASDNVDNRDGTASTLRKVQWRATPAVQRFCPAGRR